MSVSVSKLNALLGEEFFVGLACHIETVNPKDDRRWSRYCETKLLI
jgi:hypothetical protein